MLQWPPTKPHRVKLVGLLSDGVSPQLQIQANAYRNMFKHTYIYMYVYRQYMYIEYCDTDLVDERPQQMQTSLAACHSILPHGTWRCRE